MLPRSSQLMDVERLAEDVADALARVERGERVLEDHRHLPSEAPHRRRAPPQHILALEEHLARGRLDEAEDGPA